ncbi:MAG: succinate dehydrogenase/fumarate reductase iron-sulfur subunit [Raoultibacter sp.]|jgi:fumarate reductase iron-sulfur subunit
MKITLERFNPAVDAKPYEVEYEVPYHENITVLEALTYIRENYDPIAMDWSCRGRQCGRCAVMINEDSGLACVNTLSDRSHTIRPLRGHPVIKDLVVDKTRAHESLSQTYLRQRALPLTPEEEETFNMEMQPLLKAMEYCSRCQSCTAICPAKQANPSYVGPSQMVAIAYRHADPYDEGNRIAEAVKGGLWSCIMCGQCDSACAALEIKHLELWEMLRADATAAGYPDPAL